MSKIMFDDVTVALLPSGAYAYAGYVDGAYRNADAIRARFPKAHILTIAVFAQDDADALDMEPGDATIAQAYAWFRRQVARGVYRPVVYIAASSQAALETTMYANGFKRESFRLWSAHYTGTPHFCGPHTCGYGLTEADATQYTDRAHGLSLDESVLQDTFFAPKPAPAPAPVPTPTPPPVPTVILVTTDGTGSLLSYSATAKVPVSTILRWTVERFHLFDHATSVYLQAGDLAKPMPANVVLVTAGGK